MGAILKFIIFIAGIFFLLSMLLGASTVRLLLRLLFKGRRGSQQNRNQPPQEPINQTDRIISYKKKEFETTVAQDVEFEEVKEEEEI